MPHGILGMVLSSLLLVHSRAAMTCCVAVQAGSWNRPNLPEKRDPFQLNQLWYLVQHWALQTSVPVREWCARQALFLPSLWNFLDSVLSLLLFYAAIFHSVQKKCNWLTYWKATVFLRGEFSAAWTNGISLASDLRRASVRDRLECIAGIGEGGTSAFWSQLMQM